MASPSIKNPLNKAIKGTRFPYAAVWEAPSDLTALFQKTMAKPVERDPEKNMATQCMNVTCCQSIALQYGIETRPMAGRAMIKANTVRERGVCF